MLEWIKRLTETNSRRYYNNCKGNITEAVHLHWDDEKMNCHCTGKYFIKILHVSSNSRPSPEKPTSNLLSERLRFAWRPQSLAWKLVCEGTRTWTCSQSQLFPRPVNFASLPSIYHRQGLGKLRSVPLKTVQEIAESAASESVSRPSAALKPSDYQYWCESQLPLAYLVVQVS